MGEDGNNNNASHSRRRPRSKDNDRRICRKISSTIEPENEDFIRDILLPNNPALDGSFSAALNKCVQIVRISHGY